MQQPKSIVDSMLNSIHMQARVLVSLQLGDSGSEEYADQQDVTHYVRADKQGAPVNMLLPGSSAGDSNSDQLTNAEQQSTEARPARPLESDQVLQDNILPIRATEQLEQDEPRDDIKAWEPYKMVMYILVILSFRPYMVEGQRLKVLALLAIGLLVRWCIFKLIGIW